MIRNANVYSLKENYSSRSLSAVLGDKNHNRFLVGTYSLKMKNEVYLLNFNEFNNKIVLEGLFSHDEEIFNLSACPYDANLFVTSYATGTGEYAASMYDLGILTEDVVQQQDEDDDGNNVLEHNDAGGNLKLKKVIDFGHMDTPANSILWDDELVCEAYGKKKPEEIII